jgi:uncharacterized protein (TIGR02118 family)
MADLVGSNGDRKVFKIVGKLNIPGRLSYSIATGEAKFGSDVVVPGMRHAKFLLNQLRRTRMIRVSVLYPNEGGKFDFDYYIKKHIPLVHKLLKPYGLVKTEVDKSVGTPAGGPSVPFIAVGHMIFDTMEGMQKGIQAHDPDLAADLVNFTDIQPKFQISEILD